MMRITLWIMLMVCLPLVLFGQQEKEKKEDIILEKKYTIPITEKLRIRSVKKTGKLKIVHLRPEVNPILYDKTTFYHKLRVKKRKSFREIFNYPILHTSLIGGTSSWLASTVGFQINGGKIVPSMIWNFDKFDNDVNNEFRFMNFQGGVRYNVSSDISVILQVKFEDGNQKYNITPGVVPLWRLPSGTGYNPVNKLNADYSMLIPAFAVKWMNDEFSGDLETGYLDLKQTVGVQNDFQDTYLKYQMTVPLGFWYLWSAGEMHAVLSEIQDLDSTVVDGAYMQISGGVGLRWKQLDVKLGMGYLNQEKILIQKPDRNIFFTGNISAGVIPDVLTVKAGYYTGFERVDIIDNLPFYSGIDLNLFGPNLINNGFLSGVEWMPVDSLTVFADLKWKQYSDFHVLNVFPKDSVLIQAFTLSHDDYQMGIISAGAEYVTGRFLMRGSLSWMTWKKVGQFSHIPLFPEKTANLLLRYHQDKWMGEIDARFESDRYLPGNTSPSMESFLDLGARIQYRIHPNVKLALIGQNLLNSDMETVPHLYFKSRMMGLQMKVTF